jgi:DNA polymerase-3 subunit beta
MQIHVLQENLEKGLKIVKPAVPRRPGLPVLSNVLIRAQNGAVELIATDLETAIVAQIGAQIEQPGETTIPARTLADLVGTMPQVALEIASNGGPNITLTCDDITTNINGIPATDFPVMSEPEGDPLCVDAAVFVEMVEKVSLAAATDTSRPILTGVLAKIEDGHLIMAAADGFRLAEAKREYPDDADFHAIIPAQALETVARITAADDVSEIDIYRMENRIVFRIGAVTLAAQLVDGAFPDYLQIVPESYTTRVIVDRSELLTACQRATVFARESAYVMRLKAEGYTLTLSASSSELGSGEFPVGAGIEGEATEVAFNARYMTDALSAIETERVALELGGPKSPGVLRPVGGDSPYLVVIMPMHLHR